MAETAVHVMIMVALISTLRTYYRNRPDVFVIGNIFWYYEEGNPSARRSPDVMVVKGVDPKSDLQRRSFKTWEERAVPSVVLEITSEGTADEDLRDKRALYEQQGVSEYFLFDPLREYLERPLVGYRLIGGVYEPLMPAADGSLPSKELGLRLRPDGESLALIEMRTGERLRASDPETERALEEARARAGVERQAREEARRQAEAEREAREEAQRQTEAERQAREEAQRQAEAEREARRRAQEQAEAERRAAVEARERTDEEHRRAEAERQRAEEERQRADALAAELARLRALLPPDQIPPTGGPGGP
jgi:Uma2 family endonuclease